jgi:hypothetical protein
MNVQVQVGTFPRDKKQKKTGTKWYKEKGGVATGCCCWEKLQMGKHKAQSNWVITRYILTKNNSRLFACQNSMQTLFFLHSVWGPALTANKEKRRLFLFFFFCSEVN